MNPLPYPACRYRGFTLTEMAVVLVIIALMIGGLLVPLSAQRNVEARRGTDRDLANIREALLGYAISHGRLPCPAQASIATASANAGLEAYSGASCTCSSAGGSIVAYGSGNACNATGVVSGVLPWATLGLPENDGWNDRYSYTVTAAYARQPNTANAAYCDAGLTAPSPMPANAAFALCTSGLARIYLAADKAVALTTANEVPAVVVSHGDNGLGAWLATGSQRSGAVGDEAENADGNTDFVSSSNIDDMLIWVSRPILMNRMIAAGKLP